MVLDLIGSGSYGSIYKCGDLEKPKHHLVVKISDKVEILGQEIEALIELRNHYKKNQSEYPYDYFPRCVNKGLLLVDTSDTSKDIICIKNDEQFDQIYDSCNQKAKSFFVMN